MPPVLIPRRELLAPKAVDRCMMRSETQPRWIPLRIWIECWRYSGTIWWRKLLRLIGLATVAAALIAISMPVAAQEIV